MKKLKYFVFIFFMIFIYSNNVFAAGCKLGNVSLYFDCKTGNGGIGACVIGGTNSGKDGNSEGKYYLRDDTVYVPNTLIESCKSAYYYARGKEIYNISETSGVAGSGVEIILVSKYVASSNQDEDYEHVETDPNKPDIVDKDGKLDLDLDLDFDGESCDSYLGNPKTKGTPASYLQFVFDLMKYLALIILFVMTIFEFGKATVSSNQDAMKKAMQNTIKRLIIAIVIFFLPILINFILTLLGIYSPSTCGIS